LTTDAAAHCSADRRVRRIFSIDARELGRQPRRAAERRDFVFSIARRGACFRHDPVTELRSFDDTSHDGGQGFVLDAANHPAQ
jgi:hypothetical protein